MTDADIREGQGMCGAHLRVGPADSGPRASDPAAAQVGDVGVQVAPRRRGTCATWAARRWRY